MLQADFPRFREILAGMAEVYQRELSGPLADAYWLALQDWTLPDFEAAARNLLTTSQFFPRPADFAAIRNAANKRTAGEAWLEALDACPNWRYGTASVDPLTDRVVAMLGGYKHLAMEPLDQQHWTAKRFTEMYENLEAVEQMREAGTTPDEWREIAGGVKQRLLRMAMDARRRAGWPDGRGMVDVRP